MTTYNGSKYITESIDSVLSQTMGDFELLVVDDCSADDTVDIVEAYRDARIVVVRNGTNLGVVGARNLGASMARGEYVAALDHDDVCAPDRLEKQAAYLDGRREAVAVSCVARDILPGSAAPRESRRVSCPDASAARWALLMGNPFVYSGLMFRRGVLDSLGYYMDVKYLYADDYDFYHRLLRLGELAQVPEALVYYRYHATNTAKRAERVMLTNASAVLAVALRRGGFGGDAERAASDVIFHCSAGWPVLGPARLAEVASAMRQVRGHFLDRLPPEQRTRATVDFVDSYLSRVWDRVLRASVRSGNPTALMSRREFASGVRPSPGWFADGLASFCVGCYRALTRGRPGSPAGPRLPSHGPTEPYPP